MGPVRDAFRPAGCVHFQPAPFFTATLKSVLDSPGVVSQFGRVRAQSGDADNTLCLSPVFPGRKTIVDHRHGAVGHDARGENKILARDSDLAGRDPWADVAVVSYAGLAGAARHALRRGGDRNDADFDRTRGWAGCVVSELQGR